MSLGEQILSSEQGGKAMRMFRDALRPLLGLMDDPQVSEIMVNAPNDVWVERGGVMVKVDLEREVTADDIGTAAAALASANDKNLTHVLDCRMPGYRIAAAIPPIAIHGPTICIRKHGRRVYSLADYLANGGFEPAAPSAHQSVALTPGPDEIRGGGEALLAFFEWMVRSRRNFLLAGATSSGKTSFLNALLDAVPPTERVITIEDTAELRLTVPNRVMFEANSTFGVSVRDLVRLALRYRPDRVVVGEARGAEAMDLMQALSTGHSGGGASLHANGPEEALLRMETLIRMAPDSAGLPLQALRQQIASTIHYVIFCERRDGIPGPRKVIRVDGLDANANYVTTPVFST